MSTSAAIGMKLADGSVKAVRLHWDGYPGHAGAILGGWYKTAEQVEALLALGELSEINETPETCVAYHRDRQEPFKAPATFPSVDGKSERRGRCSGATPTTFFKNASGKSPKYAPNSTPNTMQDIPQ